MALTNEEEQELNTLLQKIDNYDQMNKVSQWLTTLGDSLTNKPEMKLTPTEEERERAKQLGDSAAAEKSPDYSWAKGMADVAKKNSAIKPSVQSVFSSGGAGDESNFESRSNVAKEGSKENPILASTLTVEKQAKLPAGTYIKDSKGRVRKLEQNEIDWANSQKSKPTTQQKDEKPTTQQKDDNPYAMNIEDGKKDEGRGGVTDVPKTEKDYESQEEKAAREAEERKQFDKSEGILYYTDKNGVEKPVFDKPMKNLSMDQIAYMFSAAKKEGDEEKQKALQTYIYEDPARRAAAMEWQKNHSKK